MQSEIVLLEAACSLDQEALEEIFDEYAPKLYKYLIRLGMGSQESDQTVGDVFARLLEKISEGKGPRINLRSYLYQTTYHLFVDHARDKMRAAPLEVAETIQVENKSVQAQTEDKILLEKLSAAMEKQLTEEQRSVIVLRFQEGFSLKETAEIIGKSSNAIKALQYRGINKLLETVSYEDGVSQDA